MNIKDIHNSTILIVDDQPNTVGALREYLELCGLKVFIAENGEQALKVTRTVQPDIIVLDVLMPLMDGFETCRRLKEDEQTKDVPVIFVSAYSETIDKVKGFDVGGVDYITKPFHHEEVVVRIAAHLRLRKLQKSLQENNLRLQQEIEQRRQAEEALLESREEFRTIFENAPVMINSLDSTGKFQLWNKECEKRLGYLREELNVNDDPFALLYPESQVRAQVMADIAQADGIFREYTVTRKDKAQIVQLWANFLLPTGMVIGVGHDITDRKQAEQNLLESQQYARSIIESSLDMIITVDQDRNIVEFNNAAEEAFGYTRAEVEGKNISMLYAHTEESSSVGQTMAQQQQSVREVYNRRKNGEIFPCLLAASTLRDARGEPIGYMGISRDITELKKAQAELLAAHNELQEKNVQLQELNASKDKFFSIISHDLKNPFSTLLGFGELLTENFEKYEREKIKSFIWKMQSSAEKLYALLENLLTWSRIQRGVMECSPKLLDLTEIVNTNIELFVTGAERKQIILRSAVSKGTFVYADASMIDTVIRNLISNAMKFTSTDGIINVSSAEHNDHYQAISISDTGVGIPEEVLPKILRIDTHYTHVGTAGEKGTGLGLILCRELVEKNGGKLWVKSEVGKGTTFTFTLPKQPME